MTKHHAFMFIGKTHQPVDGCVVIELEDCRPTAPSHDAAVKVALETPLG
jgi:hypothetical protein